jgi:L-aspartate oxidase
MDFSAIHTADLVVVGSGAAGLTAALEAHPARVAVLTKGELGLSGSSAWAQGGIAAAVGPWDSTALHSRDTLAAGAGLNDPEVVDLLTASGPERIARLLALGTRFDRRADSDGGGLALGREAAHSRRRILHANGDATGAEIMRALTRAAWRAHHLDVFENTFAWDLVVENGRVAGLTALGANGEALLFRAPAVVLATGGLGRLYSRTTNPDAVTGDGLGMAGRAGARLVDVEMVQFHPTALAAPGADPLPLLTEALRGEGAVLIDGSGHRFMLDVHPDAELAPRDIVARAIHERLAAGEDVFLDAREAVGAAFPERFPTVYASARKFGLDPRVEPLPVSPAAHYHMGGIATDDSGRSSLPGLWACGEAASTGAHGANRLASNSLLEALVFGSRVAADVAEVRADGPRRLVPLPAPPPEGVGRLPMTERGAEALARLRDLAWRELGLVRDGAGLEAALAEIDGIARDESLVAEMGGEGRNLLLAARLVAAAALERTESRGGHFRSDRPETRPELARRLSVHVTGYDLRFAYGPLVEIPEVDDSVDAAAGAVAP